MPWSLYVLRLSNILLYTCLNTYILVFLVYSLTHQWTHGLFPSLVYYVQCFRKWYSFIYFVCSEKRLLGHVINYTFNFLRCFHIIFHGSGSNLHFYKQYTRIPFIHQHLLSLAFLIFFLQFHNGYNKFYFFLPTLHYPLQSLSCHSYNEGLMRLTEGLGW